MMINKRFFIAQMLFLLIFFALTTAPLTNLNIHGERAPWENRFLAKPPHLSELKLKEKELKVFTKQCEEWLKDRMGFREKMVPLYSRFHYILGIPAGKPLAGGIFHYSNDITVGREGELFFNMGSEIYSLFYNREKLISDMALQYAELKLLTDSLGVPTKALIIPTKVILDIHNLPYYMRKFVPTPPPPPLTLKIKESLQSDVKQWIIYPYEEAKRHHASFPLYPKMDYHWKPGVLTKITASLIAEAFGLANYEEAQYEEFEKCSVVSDIQYIAGFPISSDDGMCYKRGVFEAMGIFINKYPALEELDLSRLYSYSLNKNHPSAPKILWIGDSFSPDIIRDLARYFSEALSMNILGIDDKTNNAANILKQIIADYHPDYIIFEANKPERLPTLQRFFK